MQINESTGNETKETEEYSTVSPPLKKRKVQSNKVRLRNGSTSPFIRFYIFVLKEERNTSRKEEEEEEEEEKDKNPIANEEELAKTQEPFNIVVRALLTHPDIFVLTKKASSSNTRSETATEEALQKLDNVSVSASETTVNEMYHVLLSCYVWKMLQVLISSVLARGPSPSFHKPVYHHLIQAFHTLTASQPNLDHLSSHVLPFLRKCYILFHSCGMVCFFFSPLHTCFLFVCSFVVLQKKKKKQTKNNANQITLDNDVLWSSVPAEKSALVDSLTKVDHFYDPVQVLQECDSICEKLFLPTLKEYMTALLEEDQTEMREISDDRPVTDTKKESVLLVMRVYTKRYLEQLNEGELKYILSTHRTDSIRPVLLATLPTHFDPILKVLLFLVYLFKACKETCPGGVIPEKSAVCLFCGKFLCIRCCLSRGKGALTVHSKSCGQGKGLFLRLQTSTIILMYEHAAAVFSSPYLDSHGEEDHELKRGNLLSLNDVRFYELCKLVADEGIPNKVCEMRHDKHQGRNWF
ncbi:hypothetical protein RFI_10076 [Reticulomyxa filosa]|uniref:E3 ubiquitin-protein ligase n=1 Tax=Reticulomyxa filosa TaxID=46433 RepID=X6NL93_RETFI|nr:hypothetical protein RFI_10076 [Reticulomyxa filosa]|eukprot:ETO27055.1 hypothetical protein RFI_10076 [Reticulomyxa filosa]